MQYESYDIEASDSLMKFAFWSEGPKGRIKKQVVFNLIEHQPPVFNLMLGDVINMDIVDDKIVTDNRDTAKVLATVAYIVEKLLSKYPECFIHIRGGTKSRNRLYRMAISNNLFELTLKFEFFGLIDIEWEPFKKEKDYNAFLVRIKK